MESAAISAGDCRNNYKQEMEPTSYISYAVRKGSYLSDFWYQDPSEKTMHYTYDIAV